MSRYVILGGFLGAGKTTTMLALSDCVREYGGKSAILVNDLGAEGLVDQSHTAAEDRISEEITGGCICYQTENLVDRLRKFRDEKHADIIFSDIPGCGIGALDHVYHKLNREYHGEFTLCPFVAVADPERLKTIMPEKADINLPDEMCFLFNAQLEEAEVIVLNKIDTLTKREMDRCIAYLHENYPHAAVFPISARYRIGIKELLIHLMSEASRLPVKDIGYGSEAFIAAESKLSWYDCQAKLSGLRFVMEEVVETLINNVRKNLKEEQRNVPHLKVWAEDEYGSVVKASLIGVDYPIEFDRSAKNITEGMHLSINARAACESDRLSRIMDAALAETAKQFALYCEIFRTECFGMIDE